MQQLHKLSLFIVWTFLGLHLTNQLAGFDGAFAYSEFMALARMIYRHPIVEALVLLAFGMQLITGWMECKSIWRQKSDAVRQIKAASSLYLGFFIIIHISIILYDRLVQAMDTNLGYIAASLARPTSGYVYMVFYGLSILAIFVQIGSLGYEKLETNHKGFGYVFFVIMVFGAIAMVYFLLLMLSGGLYPIDMPAELTATY
jgi:hypothetical protein